MVSATYTALFGTLVTAIAAQSVDIFLPEYGRYQDSLVAQSVGEDAGVTTYLIACGPQTETSISCLEYPTGVGRDGETPPVCTGDSSYNTYTRDSCVLEKGATLLEGPSTIVFVNAGDGEYTVDCSVAGTVSAVCTQTFTDAAFGKNILYTDTVSGAQFSFYHVPLTTGLTANGPLPTLKAGGQVSTSSAAPSTSSAVTLPKATASTTVLSTTSSTIAQSSTSTQPSSSTTPSSSVAASSGLFISSSSAISGTSTPAIKGSSSAVSITPIATETSSGARALTQWMGAAAAAVVVVAAIL